MISNSRLSRIFSARNRESSISSKVTALPPAPLSLPAAAALTQLRKVCSTRPNSFATPARDWPSFTRLTASSLNSSVYACFGIFILLPSKVTSSYVTLGRRNSGGTSLRLLFNAMG